MSNDKCEIVGIPSGEILPIKSIKSLNILVEKCFVYYNALYDSWCYEDKYKKNIIMWNDFLSK